MSKIISPLISVIIPCYNAELYIKNTLLSILNQSISNIEIIVINDGSLDDSLKVISEINDDRIKLFNQNNQGVSLARNKGLQNASGTYVIFFDADDLMSNHFLEKRIQFLQQNQGIDFVCSMVHSFVKEGEFITTNLQGAVNNMKDEVLMYNSNIVTCPSNYLFKKDSLLSHKLLFNPLLSSPADRFFLLEVEKNKLKGGLIKDGGELYYRIHNGSMSHHLTPSLLKDTELYYTELLKHNLISPQIKRKVLARGYYIISGSNFKLRNNIKAFYYSVLSFINSPSVFLRTWLLTRKR